MLRKLVGLRLREIFSQMQMKSKNRKATSIAAFIALYAFFGVWIGLLFVMIFLTIAYTYSSQGLDWVYFSFAGIMAFMLCFVGSVFLTYNQIFNAKDNETMLAMPLKPSMILLSRIVSLLGLNYIYELMIMIPAAGVYFFVAGFSAVKLVGIIISALFLPVSALALSMLCGWGIAAVSSRSGRRNRVVLVLSAGLLVVYIYFCAMWQTYMDKMAQNGAAVGDIIGKLLPFYAMGKGCGEGNVLYVLLFAVITLVPFAIVYALISKSFIKIATRHKGGKKIEYRAGRLKVSGARRAYVVMEIKRFTASNTYMLNDGIGLVLMLILSVYILIRRNSLDSFLSRFGWQDITGAVLCAALIFCASLVIISSSVISLDAKTLWVTKSIPIKESDILLCKMLPHIILSTPFLLLSAGILQFAAAMPVVMRVVLILLPLIFNVFMAEIGLIINLRFPKFNWTNEAVAIKQAMSPFLVMLIGMACDVMIIIASIAAFFTGIISITTAYVILTIIIALLTIIFYRIITVKGVKLFRDLG